MISCGHLRWVVTLVLVLLCVSAVLQSGMASAQDANPVRDLPGSPVQRGKTFDVIVTFAAPSNDFNAIGIVDNVPAGWDIQVDMTWCTPNADQANIEGNQSQYAWYGPYDVEQEFTALYKVTIPADAEFDTYLFDGELGYIIATGARIFEDIGGDSSTDVTVSNTPTIPTPTSFPSSTLTPTHTPMTTTTGGIGLGVWTGIGIGILAGILLLVGLVIWIVKRQRIKED